MAADRRRLALVVIAVAVAVLMITLDATAVHMALPSAQHALGGADRASMLAVTFTVLAPTMIHTPAFEPAPQPRDRR
jgi:hypothetical protein